MTIAPHLFSHRRSGSGTGFRWVGTDAPDSRAASHIHASAVATSRVRVPPAMDSNGRAAVRSIGAQNVIAASVYRDSIIANNLRQLAPRFGGAQDSTGVAAASELRHTYSELIRQPQPVLEAETFFTVERQIRVGARTHQAKVLNHTGGAAIVRQGRNIPKVGLGSKTEDFQIVYIATSWETTIQDRDSAGFVGVDMEAENYLAGQQAVNAERNRLWWYGDADSGLYGVLTYPDMPRVISTLDFETASPDEILAELNRLAAYAMHSSRAVYRPTDVIFSDRVGTVLKRYRASGSDKTILQCFEEQNRQLTVRFSHELDHVDDYFAQLQANYSGILFYRSDRMGVTLADVLPFTVLPQQAEALGWTSYAYSIIGGAVQRYSPSNLLAFVKVPAI